MSGAGKTWYGVTLVIMENMWAEKPKKRELNWKQYIARIGVWKDQSVLRMGGNHPSHEHAYRAICNHGLLVTIAKAKC